MVQQKVNYGGHYGNASKKLKLELPDDRALPLRGIYLGKLWVKDMCAPVFTAVLFIIMEETSMAPDRGMSKAGAHAYDGIHRPAIKKKAFAATWIDQEIILSEENIKLAYRTIKGNSGSNTAGTDGKTIKDVKSVDEHDFVDTIRKRLHYYKPQSVKRVEIPKPDGKTRPLGIPTIGDRLVQQCILQVLEPICEAKFHERSNGFRPNRSAHHAMAQCYRMIQKQGLHFVHLCLPVCRIVPGT